MTTKELIEKHGIGVNCLSDAYDLGVSDFALKVIQAYYDGTLDECEINRIERMLKENKNA